MMQFTRLPLPCPVTRITLLLTCQLLCASRLVADEPVGIGSSYAAHDTLSCGQEASEDARLCLAGLTWKPADFTVRCEESKRGFGDFLVRFPSPIETGDVVNDQVAMEWYAARDTRHNMLRAPAVVVVHESGSNMAVGRAIARGLQSQQLHAFLIQLPGYGVRKTTREIVASEAITALRQAVADVRRARDAVVVLPCVDTTVIGLQGTSLGGFVTATVAGLDHGYNRVFILLAGGNLQTVIEQGGRDSAALREKLKAAGIEGEKLRELTQVIEPMRLAHRMEPQATWLYSGEIDDVVPPACSRALADAARLPAGHHIVLPVDHYSGIFLLPKIILEIHQAMTGAGDKEVPRTGEKPESNTSDNATSAAPPAKRLLIVAPERFHDSLSEFLRHKQQLLRRSRDGAVAYIGCNTGSQPCALSLVDGFIRALAADPTSRLGDCWAKAVAYYYQRERLDKLVPTDSWYPASIFFQGMKFMFFGDPSLRLRVMPSIDGNEPAAAGAKQRT